MSRYGTRLRGTVPAVTVQAAGGSAITNVEQMVAEARARLARLTPLEAYAAVADGAILIDIRSESHRAADGIIAEAYFVPRNVLEWRLDPASPWRDPELARAGARIILICHEGCQSSLAAASLRDFGLDATDVIDGFTAWSAAGLPIVTAAVSGGAEHFAGAAPTRRPRPL